MLWRSKITKKYNTDFCAGGKEQSNEQLTMITKEHKSNMFFAARARSIQKIIQNIRNLDMYENTSTFSVLY